MNARSASPASTFAAALIAELIRRGVRDIVVCPGSRSQALALAAAAAEQAGLLRLHVRTDERSAGFFALGIAAENGVAAPIIVTSGTAVANLAPAVLEAHAGRVPLLLLTADRPVELRGIRSNQTTAQAHVFEQFVRLSADIDVNTVAIAGPGPGPDADAGTGTNTGTQARATTEAPLSSEAYSVLALAEQALAASAGQFGGAPAGPVQLNLAFREPLSDQHADALHGFGAAAQKVADFFAALAEELPELKLETAHSNTAHSNTEQPATYVHDGDTLAVVVAGAGAGAEAEAFAHAAGLPLLAEAVSGSRYGREAITAYAALCEDPQVGALTERVIVFGHPTLTRQVPALLRRSDVEVIVVDPHLGETVDHYDPSRTAQVVQYATVAEGYNPRQMRTWLGAWVRADREIRALRTTVHEPDTVAATRTGYKDRNAYARAEVAVLREPVSRAALAETVWRATWPHDRLVLAASRLVRELDHLAAPRKVPVWANRGLAGIDGTVATALGVAVASQTAEVPAAAIGVTRVLIGDLALLHDSGSLLIPEAEWRPRIQLIVGNDGGGTIFDTLEAAGTADQQAFERVMYTPHAVNMAALAEAYGWQYRRIASRGELDRLMTEPVTEPQLVEVQLKR